jgi:hypothetical protein
MQITPFFIDICRLFETIEKTDEVIVMLNLVSCLSVYFWTAKILSEFDKCHECKILGE